MRPLSEMPDATRRNIRAVLTDIDDTLTTQGRLTADAYAAMENLRAAVDKIVALMEAEGMTARVSSIHVNGWFGAYDKLSMTRTLLAEVFGVDLDAQRPQYVFVGDSPNDAPMFSYFPNSVGVANVRASLERIPTPPAYITQREAGAGFVELVDFLLDRQGR